MLLKSLLEEYLNSKEDISELDIKSMMGKLRGKKPKPVKQVEDFVLKRFPGYSVESGGHIEGNTYYAYLMWTGEDTSPAAKKAYKKYKIGAEVEVDAVNLKFKSIHGNSAG